MNAAIGVIGIIFLKMAFIYLKSGWSTVGKKPVPYILNKNLLDFIF